MIDENTIKLISYSAYYSISNKRFDDARYLFERLALLYPERAFPYVGLGLADFDQGAFRNATVMFRCALDRVPDHANAMALLGASLVEDHNIPAGVRVLEGVLQSNDQSAIDLATVYLARRVCLPFRSRSATPHGAATTAKKTLLDGVRQS